MVKIDKLSRAKTQLLMKHPFFALLALSLPMIEAKWCSTMATDGRYIYYGSDFVESQTVDVLAGVIAHECLHVAWFHMARQGRRDHKLWNIATDYVINPTVLDAGLELPKEPNILLDDKYRGWGAGPVYEDLLKNTTFIEVSFPEKGEAGEGGEGGDGQSGGDEEGDGDGQSGGDEEGDGDGQSGGDEEGDGDGQAEQWGGIIQPKNADGKPLSDTEMRDLEDEIKMRVKNAYSKAKSVGKVPAGIEGLIEAVGKPKVDWQNYIQTWVKGTRPDNYTWKMPNRRYMAAHRIYLPRMELIGAGHGVLSIDTSGSVRDEELVAYVTEILGIIDMLSPDKLTLIQHDAIVQRVDEYEAGDDFQSLKIKGRGGTCIQPVFEYVNQMDEELDWFIAFTDMGIFDFPEVEPDFPVLWCSTGSETAPFGQIVMLRDPMEAG